MFKSTRREPGVEAVLKRTAQETPCAFKERCGRFLMEMEQAPGALAAGRFTPLGGGALQQDARWGQRYPELPSDTCVILSYAAPIRTTRFMVPLEDIAAAPVNPEEATLPTAS